ncbi:hypothetical protein U1707_04075 [Sphingomonas sp. PB2P12]|uniref:hypothetical protein n=1 Tax=Sphingomonas sandaracina TaxID=3096157 RepID=UPI002FC753EC
MANAPTPAGPHPCYIGARAVPVPRPRCEPAIPDDLPDAVRHVVAWQAHVDAGRIGNRMPVSPEIAANRDRWTALARTMRK